MSVLVDKLCSSISRCFSMPSMANTTQSIPFACYKKGVEQVVRMTRWAMSCSCCFRRNTFTTKNIHLTRNNLQMGRLDTWTITAEMVKLQTRRNEAYQRFIGITVYKYVTSRIITSATYLKETISSSCYTRPYPAWYPIPGRAVLIHFGPESFLNGDCNKSFDALLRVHNKTPWLNVGPSSASTRASACTRGLSSIIPQRGLAWE